MKRLTSAAILGAMISQSSPVLAAQTAKVILVRGSVTKLLPGKKEASAVSRGEVLPEDTSVLTSDKSVVRLRFSDNSTMNLGPKSKVVITKMPEKKANMINLLTGAIKAEVDKKQNKENKNKLIIKTRSAVMGVRGTKFQATFNPVNKNTTLVTVEGKVAMLNKRVAEPIAEPELLDSAKELEVLDKTLEESAEVVEVDAGKYSGVDQAGAAPTTPVKIAPVQYEALAKSMNSQKKAEDVMETEDALAEVESLEGAPKPGGFVDFDTGIYVPPPEKAKLDDKTATYTATDMGDIDQESGDYIPPKGVVLDPKKGFVVKKDEVALLASAEEKAAHERAMVNIASINKDVTETPRVNKIAARQAGSKPWYVPNSHKVGFEFVPYSESLLLEAGGDEDSDFYSESAFDALITYEQQWSEKVGTRIKAGGVNYQFEDESKFRDNVNDDEEAILSFGGSYAISKNLSAQADFVSRPLFFVVPNEDDFGNPLSPAVVSERFNYLQLGASYKLGDWREILMSVSGHALLFADSEIETEDGKETIESFGLRAGFKAAYDFSRNINLQGDLYGQRITHDVVTAHDAEFIRTAFGAALNLFWKL